MAAIKLTHNEGHPVQGCQLKSYEIDAFVKWAMYKLTMEQRHDLMMHLPGVYSQLTGVQMMVTVGKEPGEP